MKRSALVLLCALIVSQSFGQSIFLKKKSNGRLKKVKSQTYYWVQTTDGKWNLGRIKQLTDTSIVMERYQRSWLNPDPLISFKLNEVKSLSNPLINNKELNNTVGGMLVIGSALGLGLTPIVWVAKGGGEALQCLEFSGLLLGTGVVAVAPTGIKRKFSNKKWELVSR